MTKILLDSSVLIAGTISKQGASAAIMRLCQKKKVVGIVSNLILAEVLKNLSKKVSKQSCQEFLMYLVGSNLRKVSFNSDIEIEKYSHITVSKDIHVIAAAHMAKVNYLITLDRKHLLTIDDTKLGFQIVLPGAFIKLITR